MLRQVLYHCNTVAGYSIRKFVTSSTSPVPAGAGFKPTTLGWWGKSNTTTLLLLAIASGSLLLYPLPLCHQEQDWNPKPWGDEACVLTLCYCRWLLHQEVCCPIFFPCASRCRIQTFNLGMMRQILYHCNTVTGYNIRKSVTSSSSPVPAGAGFKPTTLGWWGKSKTTTLLLLAIASGSLLLHPLPLCHQEQDWNPKPWGDEACVLTLCYCRWLLCQEVCCPIFFPCASRCRIQTHNLEMNSSITAILSLAIASGSLLPHLLHLCQQEQDSNPKPWCDEVHILTLCYRRWLLRQEVCCPIFFPCASRSRIQTHNLGMMRQVLYHYNTVPGFIIRTHLLLLCQQEQDWNPKPWGDEVCVLTLCYCCWLLHQEVCYDVVDWMGK